MTYDRVHNLSGNVMSHTNPVLVLTQYNETLRKNW